MQSDVHSQISFKDKPGKTNFSRLTYPPRWGCYWIIIGDRAGIDGEGETGSNGFGRWRPCEFQTP